VSGARLAIIAAISIAIGCRESNRRTVDAATVAQERRDAGATSDGATIGETYDVGSLGLSAKDQGGSIGLDGPKKNRRPAPVRHESTDKK
jgi:hypothetical protein